MARALSHMFKEKEENKTRESFKSINPLILEELSKEQSPVSSPLIIKTFQILPKKPSIPVTSLNKDLQPTPKLIHSGTIDFRKNHARAGKIRDRLVSEKNLQAILKMNNRRLITSSRSSFLTKECKVLKDICKDMKKEEY